MLLLIMFCYLFFYTGRHNFGWATKQLAQDLHISYENIGWISFAMLIGYAAGQLVNGNLADRFSPKHMITLGGLLSVAANILLSFANNFTTILILWTLNGYFQSMAWAAGSRIISNWWGSHKRGLAYGMYTMAAGASSILTYALSIALVHAGWRNIFRLPVLFLAVAAIIFFIFIRNKPADIGLPDQNDRQDTPPDWKKSYFTAFTNKRFLLVCISLGFQSMARYGLIFWVPLYFLSKESSNAMEIWITLLLPIGMSIGALSFGFISDKIFNTDRFKSITLGMSCCCIVSMLLFFFHAQSALFISIFVFAAGFFSYGPQSNFWALAPELLGHRLVGTGTGIMNMCAYACAAIGEPLMGRLIDISGNRSIIFITVAVIALLSTIFILIAQYNKTKENSITTLNMTI
jgi:OPA family glycerol-3-phosphate transporter-like MFS transporter